MSSLTPSTFSALAVVQEMGKQPEPRKIPEEIVAAPFEAWRAWLVTEPRPVTLTPQLVRALADDYDAGRNPFRWLTGWRLGAVGISGVVWEPVVHAKCRPRAPFWRVGGYGDHDAPHTDCNCGVWGIRDEETLHREMGRWDPVVPIAFGRVRLWGRIVEHDLGYRAEYAQPVHVTVIDGTDEQVADLAAFYRCEVVAGPEPQLVTDTRAKLRKQELAS